MTPFSKRWRLIAFSPGIFAELLRPAHRGRGLAPRPNTAALALEAPVGGTEGAEASGPSAAGVG
jgi:hypothetical protein